jgi:hypothetical protein
VVLGLETATLGIGESRRWEREDGELGQRLLHACDALLEACRQGADGRRPLRLRPDRGEGVADEGGALALGAGRTPGGDQGQGLALLEVMAQRGVQESLLVLVGHAADRIAERQTDTSLIQPVLCRGGEPGGEGMAACRPGLAASEQARSRGEGEAVVAYERVDDPRLVHGRERARW